MGASFVNTILKIAILIRWNKSLATDVQISTCSKKKIFSLIIMTFFSISEVANLLVHFLDLLKDGRRGELKTQLDAMPKCQMWLSQPLQGPIPPQVILKSWQHRLLYHKNMTMFWPTFYFKSCIGHFVERDPRVEIIKQFFFY